MLQVPLLSRSSKRKVNAELHCIFKLLEGLQRSVCVRIHNFRINHSRVFADRHNHFNGIENVWNQAKRHMRKSNSFPKD